MNARTLMHAARSSLLAVALVAPLTGCGLIYTHVTVPLDTNLTGQRVDAPEGQQTIHGKSSSKHVTVQNLRVDWGKRGIGHLAREYGLTKVYYADIETMSILWFWRQRWVHIYGE